MSRLLHYLKSNFNWQFKQNPYKNLIVLPTNESETIFQLEKIADKYYHMFDKVETIEVEFCLNKLALCNPKTPQQRFALKHFDSFWNRFVRLKNTFNKPYLTFPSNGSTTRLDDIANLITKCTQFTANNQQFLQLQQYCVDYLELNEREQRHLQNVLELYKIKYYCAVSLDTFAKNGNNTSLAKFFNESILKGSLANNDVYKQTHYTSSNGTLLAMLNCLGNSSTSFNGNNTNVLQQLTIDCNGKNVFDTFCQSKFGNCTAEFSSLSTVLLEMRYFVDNTREVRQYKLTNKSKNKHTYIVNYNVSGIFGETNKNFVTANAICTAVKDNTNYYVATAFVHNNEILPNCNNNYNVSVTLQPNEQYTFEIVTIYEVDSPTLNSQIERLFNYGSTNCPYVCDDIQQDVTTGEQLQLTPHGYTTKHNYESSTVNFCYQLGDDVATFVDNGGRVSTLINGFAFGVGGEKVYEICNGNIKQINCGQFDINGKDITFTNNGSSCSIFHTTHKQYDICHAKSCRTLVYFPLEMQSKVSLCNNSFDICDKYRHYKISFEGIIESFTTNQIECNCHRLRYKLSNNLQSGNCLAVCLKSDMTHSFNLTNLDVLPHSTPLIKESLLSTYLNYVNNKNVFCLCNKLKRTEPLTVSAICYTNPNYVLQYLTDNLVEYKDTLYYDTNGKLKNYNNELTYSLACIYYCTVVDDLDVKIKQKAWNNLQKDYTGKDLCIKALALKKASQLDSFDKVRCLIDYNHVKHTLQSDSKLYSYAQTIGAVPMLNPSKQRLKDLCRQHDVAKCWYYVSQLENLYGLTISKQKIFACPNICDSNVLEQLSISVAGKTIDTTFVKSSCKSMVLNGRQYFTPFCPESLTKQNNTLVVNY